MTWDITVTTTRRREDGGWLVTRMTGDAPTPRAVPEAAWDAEQVDLMEAIAEAEANPDLDRQSVIHKTLADEKRLRLRRSVREAEQHAQAMLARVEEARRRCDPDDSWPIELLDAQAAAAPAVQAADTTRRALQEFVELARRTGRLPRLPGESLKAYTKREAKANRERPMGAPSRAFLAEQTRNRACGMLTKSELDALGDGTG